MSVSSTDGLHKLTEYLNQTRRQAELAIDTLNNQIKTLQEELDVVSQRLQQSESEREILRGHCDQLKLENSKKYRLQERDDWKSLVESIQKDRSRLVDEVSALQAQLDESIQQNAIIQEEIAHLQEQEQQRIQSGSNLPANTPTQLLIDSLQELASGDTLSEQNISRNGTVRSPTPRSQSPDRSQVSRSPSHSMKQLQEVESLKQQMERQRREYEEIRMRHVDEIDTLKQEVIRLRSALFDKQAHDPTSHPSTSADGLGHVVHPEARTAGVGSHALVPVASSQHHQQGWFEYLQHLFVPSAPHKPLSGDVLHV